MAEGGARPDQRRSTWRSRAIRALPPRAKGHLSQNDPSHRATPRGGTGPTGSKAPAQRQGVNSCTPSTQQPAITAITVIIVSIVATTFGFSLGNVPQLCPDLAITAWIAWLVGPRSTSASSGFLPEPRSQGRAYSRRR